MKQHNSKRTCNAANRTAAFLGSTRMHFQGYTCALWERKSIARYSVSIPVVAEAILEIIILIWIFEKNILQIFLFVIIGGDTYNKIFVLWDEEVKLTIRFFAYWTGFSKISIKVRSCCKLLLNKTFPLSESQKINSLKELQKIISPSTIHH